MPEIPELKIRQPSVANLAANYLQMRQVGQALGDIDREEGFRNYLKQSGYNPADPGSRNILEKGMAEYPERAGEMLSAADEQKAAEIKRRADVLKIVYEKAKTPAQAKSIINSVDPGLAGEIDVDFVGDMVTLKTQDGTKITMPRFEAQTMAEHKSADPRWWTNPENVQASVQHILASGGSVELPQQQMKSSEGKLIEDINKLSPGDPNRQKLEQALKNKITPKGMILRTNADGSVELIQGADVSGGGMRLEKTVKKDIQTKIISGREQIARMEKIASEFKPEYQEVGTRLGAAWTGLQARLGQDVSEDDAKKLTDFKKYQRKAIENINLYIKELTGAQMSEKEADRLRLAQPDPGENWWSGDDPITFKSKMDDVLAQAKMAVARYNYYLSEGYDGKQISAMQKNDVNKISIDDIPQIINAKGAELEAQFASKGMQGADLDRAVDAELKRIFGI